MSVTGTVLREHWSARLRRRTMVLPATVATVAVVAAAAMIAAGAPASAQPTSPGVVSYTVTPDRDRQEFAVDVVLHGITADTLAFDFPIWAPGAYDLVRFGRFAHDIRAARADGSPLAVVRADSNSALVIGVAEGTHITYRMHDVETPPMSVWFCTSDIEQGYVFAQGAAVFGYPAGHLDARCEVAYDVPCASPDCWDITVALDSVAPSTTVGGMRRHFYAAPNYDALIDAPVQMGRWQRSDFVVNGVPHTVTVTATNGRDAIDLSRLSDLTRRVVELVSGFFGDLPYKRYVFQHYIATAGVRKFSGAYGALEHAGSSSYLSPPMDADFDFVREMASTIAHEYFHVWSPKRIHVAELGPFDYQRAPHTASLWFAEGLTEYYSRIILKRGGLTDLGRFLDEMQADIDLLRRNPPHRSIAEVSRTISTTSMAESTPALYSQGPIIGLMLDIEIRTQTGNRKSLDDAMRYFNEEYGHTGRTFSDEDIIPIMEKATGARLQEFYRRYIAGTDTLPIDQSLARAGMKFAASMKVGPVLGATVTVLDSVLIVRHVKPRLTAAASGLRPGDRITALAFDDGVPISVAAFDFGSTGIDELVRYPIRSIHFTRGGKQHVAQMVPVSATYGEIQLAPDPHASPDAVAMRRSLIGE